MTARYRAPAEDGGRLVDPPLERVGECLANNSGRLSNSEVHIAGIPLREFRQQAIGEASEAASRYLAETDEPAPPRSAKLIVAGHQPEFFHPGVWFKNFVLYRLAEQHGLTPLNLIVDNDLVKSTTMRVPMTGNLPDQVAAIPRLYDEPAGDRPYEEYRLQNRAVFDSFTARLSTHVNDWGQNAIAHAAWPAITFALDRGATFAEAVSRARRGFERRWGVTNFELPVSRLAATRAFGLFFFSIVSDLPRFVECYNAAIREYRDANKLRSLNHPAPELTLHRDALEAPFWAWRSESTKRERVFVRDGKLLVRDLPIGKLARSADEFANGWHGEVAGWKIRPRALTLTLFVRICLAEMFIHGIGGAKYDEVTDEIIRHYFGIEPPSYAIATATLRLPLPRFATTPNDLHAAERRLRDLIWNPQRFKATQKRYPDLVAAKVRLIEEEPSGHSERRTWFRKLQELTREMRPAVAEEIAAAELDLERKHAELAANEVLASREYAWPLFSEEMLRSLFVVSQSV